MASLTKKKATYKFKDTYQFKVASDKDARAYHNDPYFVEKREKAEKILNEIGLPESFIKPRK